MKKTHQAAYLFIVFFGVISLFSDLTYEGARSILGPYMALLGASAATVGFVSGLGEFIGYGFRLLFGYLSDQSKHYWRYAILGYSINLLAIPLLAFVPDHGWIWASGLILLERFGKAIRHPSKTTLVSFAANEVGAGKGFAIQEVLDQFGAFLGPLILFIIFYIQGDSNTREAYTLSFLFLGLMGLVTIGLLLLAKRVYPHPEEFDQSHTSDLPLHLTRPFWLYMVAVSFLALGFADFPLVSFHMVQSSLLNSQWIPLVYSLAMIVDALSALVFGTLFDKIGVKSLMIAIFLSAFFAPFAFLSTSIVGLLIGASLWGVGMGAQESILKSTVSQMIRKNHRATAFGIFYAVFGLFWFLGSWTMGILYDWSIVGLVLFSVSSQLMALPLLYRLKK